MNDRPDDGPVLPYPGLPRQIVSSSLDRSKPIAFRPIGRREKARILPTGHADATLAVSDSRFPIQKGHFMKVENKPDFPITDSACKKATGKTLKQWFKELDAMDGLEQGRRACTQHIYTKELGAWWPTTIYVEYEAQHGITKKDGLAEGYSICATKSIGAPVAKVYKTWTSPKKFAEMFGDQAKQSVKVDGEIKCDAGCHATFTRIRPEKDLRFMWEHDGSTAPMQVDVQFQDKNGKCLMNVMTSRIQTRGEADGLRAAWAEALNRLKAMCE